MKTLQILRIPWYAMHRSLRWLMLFVFLTVAAGGIASGSLLSDKPDGWKLGMLIFCIGQMFLWIPSMTAALRLAIATRQWRVPGVQWQLLCSLLVYVALSVSVPTAWLAMHGAPVGPPAMLLSLCACAGLAFATLPGYLMALVGFLPGLFAALHAYHVLPDVSDPSTALPVGLAALALLLIAGWRAQRLLLSDVSRAPKWSSPLALLSGSPWSRSEVQQLRLRPNWLSVTPDIAHAGPSQPDKAIRLVLGGLYVPQTWKGYGKKAATLIITIGLPLFLFALVQMLVDRNTVAVAAFLGGALSGGTGTLLMMAGPLIGFTSVFVVRMRWQRTSAELPLLALLPRLGDARGTRSALLHAGLGVPALMHALVALLAGVAVLFWQTHVREYSFFLLAQFGMATITGALVVNIFGGRALALWSSTLLLGLGWVLTMFSLTLPMLAWRLDHPVAWAGELLLPLALAWLLLVLAMLWLARRGWHGLRQLPHVFMASQ